MGLPIQMEEATLLCVEGAVTSLEGLRVCFSLGCQGEFQQALGLSDAGNPRRASMMVLFSCHYTQEVV